MIRSQLNRSEYVLTKDEVMLIISNAGNFRDRCIIKCLYYGGMRVREVTDLKIQYLNFDRRKMDILGKGNKIRSIPFIDMTYMTDLKHYIGKKREGIVFLSNRNEHMTTRAIQYIVSNTASSINIQNPNPLMNNINPHIFRHSIARHLKDERYPLEFIQKFLGHSSGKITMDTYGTMSFNDMQKMVTRQTGDINLYHDRRTIQNEYNKLERIN